MANEKYSEAIKSKYRKLEVTFDGDLIDGSDNIYRVRNMVEKPKIDDAPSNLAIIGRYILTPKIFEVLAKTLPDKNGEIQITDALLKLANEGEVLALKFNCFRFDCGSISCFLKATNHFAKKEGLL